MEFLHNGCPRRELSAVWTAPQLAEPELPREIDLGAALKEILASYNVCSKEWVIRQYDHEVQGASVVKPLGGAAHDTPNDAAVIAPVLGEVKALAVANGLNPKYSDLDPYAMAANAIDEALRNIIAVGGALDRCALLDNFCWGNCDKPDRLAGLVRAAQACRDVAQIYGTPFISGKDSLNNEYGVGSETICIPGTLLISAVSVMDDCRRAVTADLKQAGNALYLIGATRDELGGSHFYAQFGAVGKHAPQVRAEIGKRNFTALAAATSEGLCRSLHDCAEGGIAVAAAEMAFGGELGLEINLGAVPTESIAVPAPWQILFSESASRLLAEIAPENEAAFTALLNKHRVVFAKIGAVIAAPELRVFDAQKKAVLKESLADLKAAWQTHTRQFAGDK
jgi:phosphoribosylformylglycinamidine synthase